MTARDLVRGPARGARRWYTADEISSWPENHKGCKTCLEVLPLKAFGKHNHGLLGRANQCRACRKIASKEQERIWRSTASTELLLFRGARGRAANKKMEFTITVADIVIPELCPVFGVPLVPGTAHAPSLDRTDSSRGYVPGNIVVMSRRANLIKNNANADELDAVAKYVRSLETE